MKNAPLPADSDQASDFGADRFISHDRSPCSFAGGLILRVRQCCHGTGDSLCVAVRTVDQFQGSALRGVSELQASPQQPRRLRHRNVRRFFRRRAPHGTAGTSALGIARDPNRSDQRNAIEQRLDIKINAKLLKPRDPNRQDDNTNDRPPDIDAPGLDGRRPQKHAHQGRKQEVETDARLTDLQLRSENDP